MGLSSDKIARMEKEREKREGREIRGGGMGHATQIIHDEWVMKGMGYGEQEHRG